MGFFKRGCLIKAKENISVAIDDLQATMLRSFLGLYKEILNEGPYQEKDRALNVLLMSEEGHTLIIRTTGY